MTKRLLVLLLLLLALLLGLWLVSQRQLTSKKAGGSCLLCLFAPSPSLLVGQTAVTVLSLANPIVTPDDKGIIGIKAVLAYPSSALSISQAVIPHLPSPWTYTSTTGTTTETSGTTYLTIEAIYNQPGITGQLTLADPKIATVNFLISSPGVHTISIDILQSHIYAKNANEDILVGSFPSSLDLRATTLGTMAVQIEPGLINTTTTHAPIYLSTRAVKEFTRPTDFTYEWGLSSTGSIGNLKSDPNNPLLATFIPQNPGTGSLWVKATDPNNNTSVIKTISVYVSVSPQCVDTDGGFNTQISGAASIPDTNSSTRIEIDTCAYQNPNGSYAYPTGCYGTHCYLIERFCSGDSLQESQVSCSQGCSNGACLTPDTTPNPTVAIPTNTPTPPTTTISPTPTLTQRIGYAFRIKFQDTPPLSPPPTIGITKPISITVKQGAHIVYSNPNADATYNYPDKTWSGTILLDVAGTYDVYVKKDGYLQGKFQINTWEQNIPKQLIAGDFDGNNRLETKDFTDFVSNWISEPTPVDSSNDVYDVNFDGKLSIYDISLVLAHWTSNIVYGDN